MALTGRYDFRKTWTGKIVLRIEEEVPRFWHRQDGQLRKRWRDANIMDLTTRELRMLMDSRLRPLLVTQYGAPNAPAPAKSSPEPEASPAPQEAASVGLPEVASLDALRKSRAAPQAER